LHLNCHHLSFKFIIGHRVSLISHCTSVKVTFACCTILDSSLKHCNFDSFTTADTSMVRSQSNLILIPGSNICTRSIDYQITISSLVSNPARNRISCAVSHNVLNTRPPAQRSRLRYGEDDSPRILLQH